MLGLCSLYVCTGRLVCGIAEFFTVCSVSLSGVISPSLHIYAGASYNACDMHCECVSQSCDQHVRRVYEIHFGCMMVCVGWLSAI